MASMENKLEGLFNAHTEHNWRQKKNLQSDEYNFICFINPEHSTHVPGFSGSPAAPSHSVLSILYF